MSNYTLDNVQAKEKRRALERDALFEMTTFLFIRSVRKLENNLSFIKIPKKEIFDRVTMDMSINDKFKLLQVNHENDELVNSRINKLVNVYSAEFKMYKDLIHLLRDMSEDLETRLSEIPSIPVDIPFINYESSKESSLQDLFIFSGSEIEELATSKPEVTLTSMPVSYDVDTFKDSVNATINEALGAIPDYVKTLKLKDMNIVYDAIKNGTGDIPNTNIHLLALFVLYYDLKKYGRNQYLQNAAYNLLLKVDAPTDKLIKAVIGGEVFVNLNLLRTHSQVIGEVTGLAGYALNHTVPLTVDEYIKDKEMYVSDYFAKFTSYREKEMTRKLITIKEFFQHFNTTYNKNMTERMMSRIESLEKFSQIEVFKHVLQIINNMSNVDMVNPKKVILEVYKQLVFKDTSFGKFLTDTTTSGNDFEYLVGKSFYEIIIKKTIGE